MDKLNSYSNQFNLFDYVVIIFGGTGELGGNLAIHLNSLGANVTIIGRNKQKANILISQMDKTKVHFIEFNGLEQTPQFIFNEILHKFGKIDVLINACGMNSATSFEDITCKEMENIFKLNYIVPSQCCALALQQMKMQKFGSIINFGSISGITPLSKVYTYSASKAALHNLTKNLAREYGSDGIRINTVIPGFFPAEQNKKILTSDRVDAIISHTPMNRFGTPRDLFAICVLLCDHTASQFITGSEFVIDGGFNATKI